MLEKGRVKRVLRIVERQRGGDLPGFGWTVEDSGGRVSKSMVLEQEGWWGSFIGDGTMLCLRTMSGCFVKAIVLILCHCSSFKRCYG